MRIQKFLAACGVGSRRAVERLITAGRVRVDGETAHLGQDVEPGGCRLEVDGVDVEPPPAAIILIMNKPRGYVTTVLDPQGRPTVMSLLPAGLPRLYPVGRLDRDSHGLLLFTNDGPLTNALLHPSQGVWKRYLAAVEKPLSEASLNHLRRGLLLDDGLTSPCRAWMEGGRVALEIKEGRKRQVRRMLGFLGHPVLDLQREAFGPLHLRELVLGQTRPLAAAEEKALRKAAQTRT